MTLEAQHLQMSVFVSPQRGSIRDAGDVDMNMAVQQNCRNAAMGFHSPPTGAFKRNYDSAALQCNRNVIGFPQMAGPCEAAAFVKRMRTNDQPMGLSKASSSSSAAALFGTKACNSNHRASENHHMADGDDDDDENENENRHRKSQERHNRHRQVLRPSVFSPAESTTLKKQDTEAEIADKYIPLKKRRMHEHRMDGVVITTVKTEKTKEVTFTYNQVRSILSKALKEKEVDLRLEFEAILQEKLMEQYHQFTKFNEDYVTKTRTNDDASWFYVS